MIKTRLIGVMIALGSVVWLWPATTQALSEADCAEIKAAYNHVPEACAPSQSEDVAAPPDGVLTDVQRRNNIFFSSGGTEIDQATNAQLLGLAKVLQLPQMQNACLQLIGHTDSGGDANVNQAMGLARAEAVQQALGAMIGGQARIESTVSAGETKPLSNLRDDDKRQRRVEIRARDCS